MNIIKRIYNEFWEQTRNDFADLKAELKSKGAAWTKIKESIALSAHNYLFLAVSLIGILQLFICISATNGECIKEFLFYNPEDPFSDMFMDYFNSVRCVFMDNPYEEAGVIYPPLCYLILSVFTGSIPKSDIFSDPRFYNSRYLSTLPIRNSLEALLSYFAFVIICTLALITVINIILRKNNVKHIFLYDICVFFSWGSIYAFDRGNLLIPAVVFIILFLLLNESPGKIKRELALICLACAISLKIYPVFFAVILLTDKQYSRFVRTGLYSVILFFAPMAFFGGYPAVFDLMKNIFFASDRLSSIYMGANINIASQIMVLEKITAPSPIWDILKKLLPLLAALGIPAAFFLKRKWKKILVLTCVFLLVPGTSMIYNLLYLIPALVYFISEKEKNGLDYLYAVLFACCSAVLPYVIVSRRSYDGLNITAGYILVCVSITAITFMLIAEGVREAVRRLNDMRHNDGSKRYR